MTALMPEKRPTGLRRWFLRMPIQFYHWGLGWLLGQRFLLLYHTGRKSGQPRQTVLEVVYHDAAANIYYIASGWGEKSDWLRNVAQTPAVTVQVGRHTFPSHAQRLDVPQAQAILLQYARQHETAFRALSKMMIGKTLDPTAEACLELAQAIPLVALPVTDLPLTG